LRFSYCPECPKRRFVEGNLERALSEEARPGAGRKLTGKEEALLVATACSSPPAGRVELLADEMVKLTVHESLSRETVRRRLGWSTPPLEIEQVAVDLLDKAGAGPACTATASC
jgi:hypothetical protein